MQKISWQTITVGQYQDIIALSAATGIAEHEKLSRLLCIAYHKTEAQVNGLSVRKFHSLLNACSFLTNGKIPGAAAKSFWVGTRKYAVSYQPATLRHRQYVEVSAFANKPLQNMHLIMASLVQRVRFGIKQQNQARHHPKIARDMLNAPFLPVYNSCLAFLQALQKFNNGYPGLFAKTGDDAEAGEETTSRAEAFNQNIGWICNTKTIAEFEGISMDETFELPVMQVFNGLLYLKAKAANDKLLVKQH